MICQATSSVRLQHAGSPNPASCMPPARRHRGLLRGLHAGRAGHEEALAAAKARGGAAHRHTQPHPGAQRTNRVAKGRRPSSAQPAVSKGEAGKRQSRPRLLQPKQLQAVGLPLRHPLCRPVLRLQFCAYMDVEPRFIELEEGQYVLDPEKLWAAVDDNTIGERGWPGGRGRQGVLLGCCYTCMQARAQPDPHA